MSYPTRAHGIIIKYTITAKPIKSLELHYPMIQFFIKHYKHLVFFIGLTISLVIQGLLNCLCLLWDISFLGACLLATSWRVLMVLAAISFKSFLSMKKHNNNNNNNIIHFI